VQAESRDGEKYNQRDRNWVRTRYPELRSEFSERAMIKLDPTDRWAYKEKRSAPLGAIAIVLIIVACGGLYYWYAFLRYSEVYHQLGISKLPSTLEFQPTIQSRLDQLSHEPCYRDAVIDLADSLMDAGYPRDADTILVNSSRRCGESDEILLSRYKALVLASDFVGAVQVADRLVQAHPANAQIRYSRGSAYEELKDFPRALADYINGIQLFGEPDTISIKNFYDVSRMYAALNRYCDAITPIETYVSFDPATRRTTQSTALIAEYARKGNCDAHYASGSTVVSRLTLPGMRGVNTLVVVVNGTPGNFILDTGATFVAVTPDFATKAKIRTESGIELPIKTVGGNAIADLGYASTVTVGKAEAQGVEVLVVRGAVDPFGGQLDGLLGMSFLARFKLSLSPNAIELTALPLQ